MIGFFGGVHVRQRCIQQEQACNTGSHLALSSAVLPQTQRQNHVMFLDFQPILQI
jgi:hypothetical protein